MNRQQALTLIACIVFTAFAFADALVVKGKVVDVETINRITQVPVQSGDCSPARPSDASLVDVLAWDLRVDCATTLQPREVADRYRVRYEWDGRVHTMETREPPGEFVDLRVDLR